LIPAIFFLKNRLWLIKLFPISVTTLTHFANLSPTVKSGHQPHTDVMRLRLVVSYRSPELPAQVVARRLHIRARAAADSPVRVYDLTLTIKSLSNHRQGGRDLEPWPCSPPSLPRYVLGRLYRVPHYQLRYTKFIFPHWQQGREGSAYYWHPRQGRQLRGQGQY
jgi:hypothetical protein